MSTTARIGQIPYLNCEPFFHGLAMEGVELCPMPPSSMGPLALRGELDAAPFSLVQSFGLRDDYESLGDMGISVIGPVRSILFYSRVPIYELCGAVVGATSESATAVQLMKVLLEQRYEVRPREYTGLEQPDLDAFLLIGDDALTTHGRVDGFPYSYDLAEVLVGVEGATVRVCRVDGAAQPGAGGEAGADGRAEAQPRGQHVPQPGGHRPQAGAHGIDFH